MSKQKRKSGLSVNNHSRRPYQTSHRPRGKTSRQTLRPRIKRTKSSEVAVEQNNSTTICEPSRLYRTPTPSIDAPGDVASKMTLGYGVGDNSENDSEANTQCLCDDSQNFTTLLSYNPRAAEKDGK